MFSHKTKLLSNICILRSGNFSKTFLMKYKDVRKFETNVWPELIKFCNVCVLTKLPYVNRALKLFLQSCWKSIICKQSKGTISLNVMNLCYILSSNVLLCQVWHYGKSQTFTVNKQDTPIKC